MTGRETFAQRMGRAGEEYTAGWLLRRGYAILARNWRCPWGELDIIARQGEFVDFVEVKRSEEHTSELHSPKSI